MSIIDKKDHSPVDSKADDHDHDTNFDSASTLERQKDIHDAYGSYEPHIFTDQKSATYWKGVYEAAHYENRHRFDPTATWTPEEERKLVRTVSGHFHVVRLGFAHGPSRVL